MVPFESERWTLMEKVADLTMQGESATAISKQLDIKRKDVLTLQEDYRTALSEDTAARDMARDHLNMMGKHYDSLIKKTYELINEIDVLNFNHQVAAQKNAAIKLVAELEAKRLDAYQKAGLLENSELGDEIAQWEEDKELMLSVLKDLCPVCQPKIANRIAKLRGNEVQEIDVEVVSDTNE